MSLVVQYLAVVPRPFAYTNGVPRQCRSAFGLPVERFYSLKRVDRSFGLHLTCYARLAVSLEVSKSCNRMVKLAVETVQPPLLWTTNVAIRLGHVHRFTRRQNGVSGCETSDVDEDLVDRSPW